jgi:hypothetical protein
MVNAEAPRTLRATIEKSDWQKAHVQLTYPQSLEVLLQKEKETQIIEGKVHHFSCSNLICSNELEDNLQALPINGGRMERECGISKRLHL